MFLAGTLILYVDDGLNRGFLDFQTRIGRIRAASIGARAVRANLLVFYAVRGRATRLWSLHDILLRWLTARAR